jgi:hypothetical protein
MTTAKSCGNWCNGICRCEEASGATLSWLQEVKEVREVKEVKEKARVLQFPSFLNKDFPPAKFSDEIFPACLVAPGFYGSKLRNLL